MTFRSCSCEKEVMQALKAGHWPDGCDHELRAHVENCSRCSDLVLVTAVFHQARAESVQEVLAVSPGLLWWRAQLRNRNEAAKKVSAPITVAQIFAWLVTMLSMVVLAASQYRHGLRWQVWWSEFSPSHALHSFLTAASKLDWNLVSLTSGLVAPSLAALILLSGVVVYLVSAKQ
jgi:hypothetical protein